MGPDSRNIVTLDRILRKRLWVGLVTREEMKCIIQKACLENAIYWRDVGMSGRSLYFAAAG